MNDDNSTPDYGYDPTIVEDVEIMPPEAIRVLPQRATVDLRYLPPVGAQGTAQNPGFPGSCAAWASTYGLATFTGAKAGNYVPATAAQQASPAYIYIQVLQAQLQALVPPPGANQCSGSRLSSYFNFLSQGGTANLEIAPYFADCEKLWSLYANKSNSLPVDSAFAINGVAAVETNNLDDIKQIIVSGRALAYGTKLYTDWREYQGTDIPIPYVGNGNLAKNKNGKLVGHCMLIIGYDDVLQAFWIQNSEGTAWGSSGYIWMAYQTFKTLAQGQAFRVVR
jgi:Papain family cysteine protease